MIKRKIDKENLSESKWEVSFFSKPKEIVQSEIDEQKSNIQMVSSKVNSDELFDNAKEHDITKLGIMFLRDVSIKIQNEKGLQDIYTKDDNYYRVPELPGVKILTPEAILESIPYLKGFEGYNIYNYYTEELVNTMFMFPESANPEDELKPSNFPTKQEKEQQEKEEREKNKQKAQEDSKGDGEGEEGEGEGSGENEDEKEKEKTKDKEAKKSESGSFSLKMGDIPNIPKPEDQFNSKVKITVSNANNGAGCNYSKDIIKLARRLADLLDIDFDTKPNEIHSLRVGKLDVNKIAEVPSGNFNVYKRMEEDQDTKPFTVAILCDESGSMSGSKVRTQLMLCKILYKAFREVLPPEKIYIYGHTSGESMRASGNDVGLYVYNEPGYLNFEKNADSQLQHDLCNNYDGYAIYEVYNRIRSHTDDPVLFIGISDGNPCGNSYGGEDAIQHMKRVMEYAKRDNFITVGVGIQSDSVEGIYQYPVVIDTLSKVPVKVSKILNQVVQEEFKD